MQILTAAQGKDTVIHFEGFFVASRVPALVLTVFWVFWVVLGGSGWFWVVLSGSVDETIVVCEWTLAQ